MAYIANQACETLKNYLQSSYEKIVINEIEGTKKRGWTVTIANGETIVIFVYPLVHKQDNSKNYFDTRDSGPHERAKTWNYALENGYKYFCLGVNDQVEKYNNYIFSLECSESCIEELSGTVNGDRSNGSAGNQIIIPNNYTPNKRFERIQNSLGTYISVIHFEDIMNYLEKYDNRPYLLDNELINKDSEQLSMQNQAMDLQEEFSFITLPDVFQNDFARRYITSLLAKPFVILTGNSGTGKTRISKQFSEYMQRTVDDGKPNWLIVPVGADWTDNSKILGFFNTLADNAVGRYEKTAIVELIESANAHKNIPYFLILDEMNLSHVERYFSDFLSHMEITDSYFELDGYEGALAFPENLFVIGTVNIDETTYMFSPKVLDRANVVEFKPEKESVLALFNESAHMDKVHPVNDGTAEAFLKLAMDIRSGKCDVKVADGEESIDAMDEVQDIFSKIYDAVEKNGFEFAYRTVKEIRQYISAAYEIGDRKTFDLYRTIDEQLLQKILPKIHGNKKEIGKLLDELEEICNNTAKPLTLSCKKIEQMKGKLATVQYASFI